MPNPPRREPIAQRIREDLLREIEHEILVDRLLEDPRYARDVLLVCDALVGTDLVALAQLFREASAALPGAQGDQAWQAPGHARQANEWGRHTSGFGVTHPPPLAPGHGSAPAGERRRHWPGTPRRR